MANDATEIVVGATGRVLVAPADSVISWPTNIATAFDAAFVEVGYLTEDGVTFTDSKTINDVNAWQSFYSVRKIVTAKTSKIEFVMRQWDTETVRLAFGGGDVDVSGGIATYTPPAPGHIDVRAMAIEWTDGDVTYRLVLPRGIVTGEVSTKLVRTEASDLPITFEVTPTGTPVEGTIQSNPFYLLSNSTAYLSGS